MQKELRLSGSGGQGVITAAIIFAEAATACGMNVAQSQSYGPEARGGASRSEVIVSDDVIYHPHVEHPDIVLAMTQAAADKYAGDLDPEEGILIVDSELVPSVPQAASRPPATTGVPAASPVAAEASAVTVPTTSWQGTACGSLVRSRPSSAASAWSYSPVAVSQAWMP